MALSVSCALAACAAAPKAPLEEELEELELLDLEKLKEAGASLPVSSFGEIWAYVVSGNEKALKLNLPVSDVVYFGAEISRYGNLVDVPNRKKLSKFNGRLHFSIACNSGGLTHFVIEEGSRARADLTRQILQAAVNFDGLNIDMELVPPRDAGSFISFLEELRNGLPEGKIFSVCVPARTKGGGPYNYEKIARISDKVFVMAYDEHWATSAPGPVASMKWCRDVAKYAINAVGAKKLIMGVPFYGRAWGNTAVSRALINSTTERIKKEFGVDSIRRVNGIPTFTYNVLVKVTVYYEDELSLATRLVMYKQQGVRSIGFWRLGQESLGVWTLLNLERQFER